jgi:2-hydroxycyclohexanecarboxyl-CoA dehydrogenase
MLWAATAAGGAGLPARCGPSVRVVRVTTEQTRTALVTGAARGIGEAIARRLAADGMRIVLADVLVDEAESTASELRGAGTDAIAVATDVADSGSVAEAVSAAIDRFGAIDVLVNNAGWDELLPFLETREPFWDRVIEINFKGPLRLMHSLLPGMIERGWGRIVNIASDAGRVGSSHESVYSGAKGGLIAVTKAIARETARAGVTANCVCPGPTDTPMFRQMISERGEKVLEAMVKAVPMRRAGTPVDVAGAVAFLASDHAGYITGQTLSVSGGLTMA